MRILFKLLYILVSFGQTILIFRIVLSLIKANLSNYFVSWVYSISDILMTPFQGIMAEEIYLDNFRIELTPIIALIFFSIVAFILSELAKTLSKTD